MRFTSENKNGRGAQRGHSRPNSSESKRFNESKSQSRGQRTRFEKSSDYNNNDEDRPRRNNKFGETRGKSFDSAHRKFSKPNRFNDRDDEFKPKFKNGNRNQGNRTSNFDDEEYQYARTKKPSFRKSSKNTNTTFTEDEGIRLNRYIANAGVCSRRDAEQYITAGVITINGKIVTELSTKVHYGDVVKFNNAPLMPEKKTYILLNKPKDYVTTTDDPHAEKTVMDLIGDAGKNRVYPVGRLDRATTGLLLLTNDGDLAEHLCHPKYNKQKIYQVTLDRKISNEDIEKMLTGIELEDGPAKADDIEYCNPDDLCEVGVMIHSGRNRIIRRMFEALKYKVKKLDRVYYAGLTKKGLPRGKWRFLTDQEITMLKRGTYN